MKNFNFTLRLATPADLPALVAHMKRVILESGRNGNVVFTPREEWGRVDEEFFKERNLGMSKSFSDCGWMREFVLVSEDQLVVGHASLFHSPPLPASLHRATLGMGIESKFCSMGYGKKIMELIINYARSGQSIEWIDLNVFEKNKAAIKLYQNYAFKHTGKIEERFKVLGDSLTDLQMSLKLR